MKKLILLLSFFSFSAASNNDTEVIITSLVPTELTSPNISEIEALNQNCKSVVCKSPSKEQTIPYIGDVPPREGNITLNVLSSIIYMFYSESNG